MECVLSPFVAVLWRDLFKDVVDEGLVLKGLMCRPTGVGEADTRDADMVTTSSTSGNSGGGTSTSLTSATLPPPPAATITGVATAAVDGAPYKLADSRKSFFSILFLSTNQSMSWRSTPLIIFQPLATTNREVFCQGSTGLCCCNVHASRPAQKQKGNIQRFMKDSEE